MLIVDFDGFAILVSWCERNWGEYNMLAPHRLYPRALCTLPSHDFTRIKKPRWRPVELNDRHLRSHGKIVDCEQSICILTNILTLITSFCGWHNVVCKLSKNIPTGGITCDYVSFGVPFAVHFFGEGRSHLSGSFPNNLQCKRTIKITLTGTCAFNWIKLN